MIIQGLYIPYLTRSRTLLIWIPLLISSFLFLLLLFGYSFVSCTTLTLSLSPVPHLNASLHSSFFSSIFPSIPPSSAILLLSWEERAGERERRRKIHSGGKERLKGSGRREGRREVGSVYRGRRGSRERKGVVEGSEWRRKSGRESKGKARVSHPTNTISILIHLLLLLLPSPSAYTSKRKK